jgi:hypothetical protein
MAHLSFETTFSDYLASLSWLNFEDNCTSYTKLDFDLKLDGFFFGLELKEKKQKYNMLNWDRVHLPEEHFFLLDSLSARKMFVLGKAQFSGLLVKDTMRNKLFFYSVADLYEMAHQRLFREVKYDDNSVIKGKWTIDLRSGVECKNFEEVMKAIRHYLKVERPTITSALVYGKYYGDHNARGGVQRTAEYLTTDLAEK